MTEIGIGLICLVMGYFFCLITGYVSDKLYLTDHDPVFPCKYFLLGLLTIIHLMVYLGVAYLIGQVIVGAI